MDDVQALFSLRTKSKRKHACLLNRLQGMVDCNASQKDLLAVPKSLRMIFDNLVGIHQRFVLLASLDDADLHSANVYLQSVKQSRQACVAAVAATAAAAASAWEVSSSTNGPASNVSNIQSSPTVPTSA